MSEPFAFFDDLSSDAGADAPVPLHLLEPAGLDGFWATQPTAHAAWAQAHGFAAQAGRALWLPGADGRLAAVLVGVEPAAPLGRAGGRGAGCALVATGGAAGQPACRALCRGIRRR